MAEYCAVSFDRRGRLVVRYQPYRPPRASTYRHHRCRAIRRAGRERGGRSRGDGCGRVDRGDINRSASPSRIGTPMDRDRRDRKRVDVVERAAAILLDDGIDLAAERRDQRDPFVVVLGCVGADEDEIIPRDIDPGAVRFWHPHGEEAGLAGRDSGTGRVGLTVVDAGEGDISADHSHCSPPRPANASLYARSSSAGPSSLRSPSRSASSCSIATTAVAGGETSRLSASLLSCRSAPAGRKRRL